MKRKLVLTPKFKRAFSSFVRRNRKLQQELEKVLELMEEDIFSASLNTHKLSGTLEGLRACSCGYDCRCAWINKENKTPRPKGRGIDNKCF